MKKIFKITIKKILYIILKPENNKILNIIINFKISLNFLDLGAAGGMQKKWIFVEKLLNVFLVEPIESNLENKKIESAFVSHEKGNFKSQTFIKNMFSSLPSQEKKLYLAKKNDCSSLFKPNFEHLNKFPDVDRFKIINENNFNTTTIDKYFKYKNIDFVKIDTEGYALEILKGSKNKLKSILGLEIESEFFHLRKKQPLFFEINNFLNNFDFEFIDFLNIVRWERNNFRFTGQPQITDALFLKKPELIIKQFNANIISDKILLKYILILTVFNRSDLIYLIVKNIDNKFISHFELEKIYKLTEKKVKRINRVYKFAHIFRTLIDNEM